MPAVLAIVLAGGEGARLMPLTADRCKPAVAFHARHRIVDFVLSNLVNSGLPTIWLMVQYQPASLVEHVAGCWPFPGPIGEPSISVLAPGAGTGYRGTADAVFRNIDRIEALRPDRVAIFSADHVYRMDVRQMLAFHDDSGADATVSTLPVPVHQCHRFGIVQADARHRITGFSEKPATTPPLPGSRTHALASMGNYVFDTDVLVRQLRANAARGGTDFGQHVLPAMVGTHRLMAYDFTSNVVPGERATQERAYWRDVGTLDAWFDAQFDTIGSQPRFELRNPQWPLHTCHDGACPARISGCTTGDCAVGGGSVVERATLDRAIVRGDVRVDAGARLEHAIVMEGTHIGAGARVRHAIVGEGNHIPAGECIGVDPASDARRFAITPGGIVVVPAGHFRPAAVPSYAMAGPGRIGDAAGGRGNSVAIPAAASPAIIEPMYSQA